MPIQPRDIVFTRDGGSQVLVTCWTEHAPTMAERGSTTHAWGPPIAASFDSAAPKPHDPHPEGDVQIARDEDELLAVYRHTVEALTARVAELTVDLQAARALESDDA